MGLDGRGSERHTCVKKQRERERERYSGRDREKEKKKENSESVREELGNKRTME